MAEKVYECKNDKCVLGSVKDRGLFTGGMTAEGRSLLTGEPVDNLVEGKDYGDGICPNCGEKGGSPTAPSAAYKEHESLEGADSNSELHDAVQERVDDPNDPLTAAEAQAALIDEAA